MHIPVRTIAVSTTLCARVTAAVVILLLSMTASVNAQNAKVYVANSSNSRILQVQFNPPSSTVVIDDANQLTQVRDIAIRDDGLDGINLIVCDRNGGQVVFYANASGLGQVVFDGGIAGPDRPEGISLDLFGNLFVMNSGQGNSDGESEVWAVKRDAGCPDPLRSECLSGGYRSPLGLIDADVQLATEFGGNPAFVNVEGLPESLVATSTAGVIHAGDLLVLTNPGGLVRYAAADVAAFLDGLAGESSPAELTPETIIHPREASVPEERRFPVGSVPNGMAFAPNGDLLITVSDGRILIYGPDGRRRSAGGTGFVDFTAGSGQDDFKIAVGLQDGKNRAFVTHRERGELRRYTINGDGTGMLEAELGGFQFPWGVDATTSNTALAPVGQNIEIAPTTIISSQIEQVLVAGQVNGRVSTFPDPREVEQTIPDDQPLHRSLFLNEFQADFPPIEIPAYARAFRLGDPNTGTPTFIVVEAESNVIIRGLVDHLAIESTILGYDPDCGDPEITKQPFMYWAPDEDDPPIVEGEIFIDITTGCGSIRGLSRDLSYFLAGVRITAPISSLVAEKLAGLKQVISSASCIGQQSKRRLQKLMTRAVRSFERGNLASVAASLREIDAQVEKSPQAFALCAVNIGGEIQSRARSAIFALSKLPQAARRSGRVVHQQQGKVSFRSRA